MTSLIEKLTIKGPVIFGVPGLRHLDQKKIIGLSDEEFASLYLELMTEYKDKDKWWGEAGTPQCVQCHIDITEPTQLRRFYGRSLHPECFNLVYRSERKSMPKYDRVYFDRVAKLDLTRIRSR